ncbi:MAG: protein kinase [Methanomicrobiales archaeon]|nr:protein kinase [Methanomicrobiales archaeon]
MSPSGNPHSPGKRGTTLRDGLLPSSDIPYEKTTDTKPSESLRFFRSYRIIKQYPATGGEADIWLIQKERIYYILKHYRLGIEPKIDVLDQVSHISLRNPKNLIKIIDYGFDDESERWYEILEYARFGSLRELVETQSINNAVFNTIIEEIVFGLDTLHKNNVLHLDLKPSNILIRDLRPLNLILTDFGISTLLDSELSRHITSTKGTPMYWAPEQMGNVVGRESDYWALGVIALEITQKKHPFEGLNHNLILSTLASRGIILSDQINPDRRILLKGLLTRNPKKRWGKREVSLWLSGKRNIPVFYEEERINRLGVTKPYEFHDENYISLHDLMYAFIGDPVSWEDAKRHIGRGYLLRWLESTEQYNKAVTISKYIEEYPDEDERLLFIAAELNKDIPFTLFGKIIDVTNIVWFLGRALNREQDDYEEKILIMLFSSDLEEIYNKFLDITKQKVKSVFFMRLFTWIKENPRGTNERKRLFQYAKILHEREIAGVPTEWSAKSVISVINIYNQFTRFSAISDAQECRNDMVLAAKNALSAQVVEPDLLVALACGFEELKYLKPGQKLLKKAYDLDIRVLTLLFNKRKGILRFRYYTSLTREYEKNVFSVSSDPWNETMGFWKEKFVYYYGNEKYLLSLSISERIIEMNKTNPHGWLMRGICLLKLKRTHEAGFCLSQKFNNNNPDPLLSWLLGEYKEETLNFSDAEQKYLDVPLTHMVYPVTQFSLARLYCKQKRFWESIEICDKVLEAYPVNTWALYYKGESLYGLGKIKEAFLSYNEACTNNPDYLPGCIKSARSLMKMGDYEKADLVVSSVISKDDSNYDALRIKAFILLKRGKKKEACLFLEKMRQKNPGDQWTQKMLSLCSS